MPPSKHLHIEEDIEGLLEQVDFERNANTKVAESIQLQKGTLVYRYFQSAADIGIISSSQNIASRAYCLCADCLKYSLSFVPHYGDGAYCTTNEQLKIEQPRVYHSHGINIREMNYRVVMRIKDVTAFKKVKNTAGVIRSVPLGKQLLVNDLVLAKQGSLKIIGFQQWDGASWIDILLEDLKEGVS